MPESLDFLPSYWAFHIPPVTFGGKGQLKMFGFHFFETVFINHSVTSTCVLYIYIFIHANLFVNSTDLGTSSGKTLVKLVGFSMELVSQMVAVQRSHWEKTLWIQNLGHLSSAKMVHPLKNNMAIAGQSLFFSKNTSSNGWFQLPCWF